MRRFALFFAVACSLLLPSKCFGQFQNHFNVYTTQSLDDNGITVHQTVTLDGYTQVPPGMPGNIVHTPRVQNKISSYGGWFQGAGTCPSCYIHQSNTISFDDIGNLIEEDDTGAQVICTIAGVFFKVGSILHWEVAFTRFVTAGYFPDAGPPPTRYYYIGPYCTAPTTPPDLNGAGLYFRTPDPPNVPTDIADGKTICLRAGSSGAWSCLPAGKWVASYNMGDVLLGNCTHNP